MVGAAGRRRDGALAGRRVALALTALVLVATACGTRIPHDEVVAAAGGGDGARAGAAVAGTSSSDDVGSPDAGEGLEPGPAADAGASGETLTPGGTPGAPAGGTDAGEGTTGQPGATAAGSAAPKEPIILGNVGSYSGLSSSQAGARDLIQVWAKAVNDRGGIKGHPVRVLTADDLGDPNRAFSIVKDMVENRNVVAFVGNYASLTLGGYSNYVLEKRIPLIGGDVNTVAWNESPVLFPQGAAIDAQLLGVPKVAAEAGGTRLGLLYCAESDGCKHVDDLLFRDGGAKRAGLEPAYHAQVAIAQPDFTQECLQAQQARVDAFYIASDTNSVRRVAASCARQGFRPTFLAGSTTLANELAEQSELEGMLGVQGVFPWFLEATPAMKEYHAAVKRYAPNLKLSGPAAQAWVAGKLFEKAGEKFGDGPVTRDQIFEGLWALRDETLGGLTPKLTFERNKPARPANCVFPIKIEKGRWTAPRGAQTICTL